MKRKRLPAPVWLLVRLAGLLALFGLLVWGSAESTLVQRFLYPYPYRPVIEHYAKEYGVDPLLVVAVIREESKFLPRSESHKGAMGLMQLMPDTARWIAQSLGDTHFAEEEMIIPEKNIQYGTWYLASLAREFKGNKMLVLAAYNGGSGHVRGWIQSSQIDLANLRVADIPFRETRDYVQRVLKSYGKYINLYGTQEINGSVQ